jgi:hypothetical protein
MQIAVDGMGQAGNSAGLNQCFQHISIVAFSPTRRPAAQTRQLMVLRRRLYQAIDMVQKGRHRAGVLFSSRHTIAFLRAATEDVASLRSEANPIEVSRRSNPVAPDLSLHLTNFFKGFDDGVALEQLAIPAAASSLILDQYPPGMHRKRRETTVVEYDITKLMLRFPCRRCFRCAIPWCMHANSQRPRFAP